MAAGVPWAVGAAAGVCVGSTGTGVPDVGVVLPEGRVGVPVAAGCGDGSPTAAWATAVGSPWLAENAVQPPVNPATARTQMPSFRNGWRSREKPRRLLDISPRISAMVRGPCKVLRV